MESGHKLIERILPGCILINTFLTPYAVLIWTSPLAVYPAIRGVIWYFPLWRWGHGYGFDGAYSYMKSIGVGNYLPVELEALVSLAVIGTGLVLLQLVREVGRDPDQLTLGLIVALATIVIEISMPVIASFFLTGVFHPSMVNGLIPIPIPGIVALLGLVYIRMRNEVPRVSSDY